MPRLYLLLYGTSYYPHANEEEVHTGPIIMMMMFKKRKLHIYMKKEGV